MLFLSELVNLYSGQTPGIELRAQTTGCHKYNVIERGIFVGVDVGIK